MVSPEGIVPAGNEPQASSARLMTLGESNPSEVRIGGPGGHRINERRFRQHLGGVDFWRFDSEGLSLQSE